MTGVAPLVFPSGRTLAGWWRQLASWQPRAIWVGHLLLHQVEALVGLTRSCRPDPFTLLTLKALASGPTLAALEKRLHLERALVRQLLRQLEADRLAEAVPSDQWTLTPLGRQALDEGSYLGIGYQRRVFYFVESEESGQAPSYLHLAQPLCDPWPAAANWGFDVGLLEASIHRSTEWKQAHGFPQEVHSVLGIEATSPGGPAQAESWQRVILDRPERLATALALTGRPGEGERLVGFAVQPGSWTLQTAEPAFVLGAAWPEVFPDLAQEVSVDLWRQAWRTWCQPRNLPAPDVEACALQQRDYHLSVLVPHRLLDRLRSARSDALKGEAWLLAGTGRLRAAALLDVVEAKPKGEGETRR